MWKITQYNIYINYQSHLYYIHHYSYSLATNLRTGTVHKSGRDMLQSTFNVPVNSSIVSFSGIQCWMVRRVIVHKMWLRALRITSIVNVIEATKVKSNLFGVFFWNQWFSNNLTCQSCGHHANDNIHTLANELRIWIHRPYALSIHFQAQGMHCFPSDWFEAWHVDTGGGKSGWVTGSILFLDALPSTCQKKYDKQCLSSSDWLTMLGAKAWRL